MSDNVEDQPTESAPVVDDLIRTSYPISRRDKRQQEELASYIQHLKAGSYDERFKTAGISKVVFEPCIYLKGPAAVVPAMEFIELLNAFHAYVEDREHCVSG